MEYLTARNGPLRSSTGKIPKERNGAKPRSLPLISSPIPRVEKGWQGPHGRATQPTQSQALKERLASQNGGQGARKKATPGGASLRAFSCAFMLFLGCVTTFLFLPVLLRKRKLLAEIPLCCDSSALVCALGRGPKAWFFALSLLGHHTSLFLSLCRFRCTPSGVFRPVPFRFVSVFHSAPFHSVP